jgi:hypothetical protein
MKNIYWLNNDPRGSKSVTKEIKFIVVLYIILALWVGRDSDLLRGGWSGDRVPVWASFSSPVQIDPGAHPASYTKDAVSFSGGKAAGAWC